MSLHHEFADPALRSLALTHASTAAARDNERLEFLGDAALDLLVAEELYQSHPDLNEGDLTELKAWIVSRKTLAEAARAIELDSHAQVGRGLGRRALSRSVMANLYEAFLGAVYLDGGIEAARRFVRATLAGPLARVGERVCERPAASPKQLLQEHCQRHLGSLPRYDQIESRGRAHARAFLVRARAGERLFPSAWGRNLKEAEHWAAVEALYVLEGEHSET